MTWPTCRGEWLLVGIAFLLSPYGFWGLTSSCQVFTKLYYPLSQLISPYCPIPKSASPPPPPYSLLSTSMPPLLPILNSHQHFLNTTRNRPSWLRSDHPTPSSVWHTWKFIELTRVKIWNLTCQSSTDFQDLMLEHIYSILSTLLRPSSQHPLLSCWYLCVPRLYLYRLVLRQLDENLSCFRRGTSVERLRDCSVDKHVVYFLDVGRPSSLWVVALSGLVVLGVIRKQAQQVMRISKQHSTMASASAPTSKVLPCLSSCPDFSQGWTVS